MIDGNFERFLYRNYKGYAVLGWLLVQQAENPDNGKIRVRFKRIVDDLGLSKQVIMTRLFHLEELGLISYQQVSARDRDITIDISQLSLEGMYE